MYNKLKNECNLLSDEDLARRSDVRLANLTESMTTTEGHRAAAILSLMCVTPERAFFTCCHMINNILTEHEFFWMMSPVDVLKSVLEVMLVSEWYPCIDVRPHDGHFELLYKPFGRSGAANYLHLTLRDFGEKVFDERLYILIGVHAVNDFLSSPTSRNSVYITTCKDPTLAQKLYNRHRSAFVFAFITSMIHKRQSRAKREEIIPAICSIVHQFKPDNIIEDALRSIDFDNYGTSVIEIFKRLESN